MIDAIDALCERLDSEDLGHLEFGELRRLRLEASGHESDVSLVRRVAQGRLDIVGHELRRRSGATGAPAADLTNVLFDLPDILTDRRAAPGGAALPNRAVTVGEPGPAAADLLERLDGIATSAELGAVEQLEDGALEQLLDRVRAFEESLSGTRRELHQRIDALQGEIARRYRDGEASVDELLS